MFIYISPSIYHQCLGWPIPVFFFLSFLFCVMDGTSVKSVAPSVLDNGAKVEVRDNETVEEYVMRVCEERVAALHKHGEEQIAQFEKEARALKASAVP